MFTNNVLNPRLDTFLRVHHRVILDSGEVVNNRGIPVTPRIFFWGGGGGGRVASDGIDGKERANLFTNGQVVVAVDSRVPGRVYACLRSQSFEKTL